MTNLTGRFKELDKKVILILNLDYELFESLKEHIALNMFLAYKRTGANFKEIIINSVGDHMNKNNTQDLESAEINFKVTLEEPLSKEYLYLLDRNSRWFICAINGPNTLCFSIDKDTQFIISRDYTNVE